MNATSVLVVIVAYLALALVGGAVLGKLLKRRRLELDAYTDREVERAATLHDVDPYAIAERVDRTGADPEAAARAILEERQLRRVWAIGDALERLPPELRRRDRRRR